MYCNNIPAQETRDQVACIKLDTHYIEQKSHII